jgi:hypothetical protein
MSISKGTQLFHKVKTTIGLAQTNALIGKRPRMNLKKIWLDKKCAMSNLEIQELAHTVPPLLSQLLFSL